MILTSKVLIMISEERPIVLHAILGFNGGSAEALCNLIRNATDFELKVILLNGTRECGAEQ